MSQDTDFGRDVMDGARDQLKAMNLQLVAETLHKPTDTDFSASVAKLHDAKCDLILLGTIVRDTVQIVSADPQVGWNVEMLGQRRDLRRGGGRGAGRRDRGHLHDDRRCIFVDRQRSAPGGARSSPTKYKKLFGTCAELRRPGRLSAAQLVVLALQKAGKRPHRRQLHRRRWRASRTTRHLRFADDELQRDQASGLERSLPCG